MLMNIMVVDADAIVAQRASACTADLNDAHHLSFPLPSPKKKKKKKHSRSIFNRGKGSLRKNKKWLVVGGESKGIARQG